MITEKNTLIASLAFVAALVPQPAFAQYKCTINGKVVYADEPCAPNARHVGALEDRVDAKARAEAEVIRRKEAMQRGGIERRENAEFQGQQRAAARHIEAEQQQAASAERARRARCDQLSRDLKWNERSVARYQDFGWQRALTQQEQEAKRNREAYDRECR